MQGESLTRLRVGVIPGDAYFGELRHASGFVAGTPPPSCLPAAASARSAASTVLSACRPLVPVERTLAAGAASGASFARTLARADAHHHFAHARNRFFHLLRRLDTTGWYFSSSARRLAFSLRELVREVIDTRCDPLQDRVAQRIGDEVDRARSS